MFRNLQIYRLPNFLISAESLASQLAVHSFTPASSNELLREGWSAPRPNGELVHAVGGQFLIKLQSEKKLLPSSVINQVTAARAAEMEEAQGFMPGKKAMRELKERVADELLPRAFSVASTTLAWIDPKNGWLVVDAASPSKADNLLKLLLKSVDKLPVESLRVQRSPVGAMTEWLHTDEAPDGFTIDMDATMRAVGESKAQIVYKRHTLEAEELRRHIAAGKQCTRLAMTWDSKISFALDESLGIKSLKVLDVLTEDVRGTNRNDEERFDGDFALMAGELAKMLADLVAALGGAAVGDDPVTRPADLAPAKADEPVRPNRLVISLNEQVAQHSDVPPGDGSAIDPMYEAAVTIVRTSQRASISLIQRHLRIGYNRAARLLEAMEGTVVGPLVGGNREVLTQGAAA